MSRQFCEITGCPNKHTRFRDCEHVCEVHYARQDGITHEKINPQNIERCEMCGFKSLNKRGTEQRLVTHHITYEPEKTIEVCDRCHQLIHNGEFPELEPSLRQQWEAERPIRKSDYDYLDEVGRVRFAFKKGSKQEEGTFVVEHGELGIYRDDGSTLWLRSGSVNRADVEFLDRTPWEVVEA